MAAPQGRRKHSACLLRIRENCPFRRLRKNKCYDIQNASTHSRLSVADLGNDIAEVSLEPEAQAAICPSGSQIQQSEEQYAAMETSGANSRSPPSLSLCCNASMELGNGVDPETGERAQG